MPKFIKSGIFFLCLFPVASSLVFAQQTSYEYDEDGDVAPLEIGSSGNLRRETDRRSDIEAEYSVHFHTMLESRYITEGRDNLNDDALFSFSTDITEGNFTFVPWYAYSASADYTELNLNFVYGVSLHDQFELYFSYTYLDFDFNGATSDDHELGIELAYNAYDSLQLVASIVHSDDAGAAYAELLVRYDYAVRDHLNTFLVVGAGYNDGYVVSGHRGFDHSQFKAGAVYFPWTQLEISAYVAATRVIDKDSLHHGDDALLKNASWMGIAASLRF